jgi:hypothetical protein
VKIGIHHLKGCVARCEASNDGLHDPMHVIVCFVRINAFHANIDVNDKKKPIVLVLTWKDI